MYDRRIEKPLTRVRLNILGFGSGLLIFFLASVLVLSIWLITELVRKGFKETFFSDWIAILIMIIVEVIIFWTGIIMVYITSVQLGIKMRIIGIACGMIPVLHIIALIMIISITCQEFSFEKTKLNLNKQRHDLQICKTRYPLLMVHGVFFRDYKYVNYWGRIPGELQKNGATIFYGNHQSAASVENSAKELAARIKEIVREIGCDKVNIIAHSKGGLDSKYAVACTDIAPFVASVTTINTPHLGCEFAEYLLGKAPAGLREKVSNAYNAALKKVGDKNPNFIEAVEDLTASKCKSIGATTEMYNYSGAGVYTQSVGSCMKRATSGAFPLNMSYHLVGHFDGPNDGLVGEPSFHWGEHYTYLENSKNRGISHGDVIDLNRENIKGFDIREFYVQLVAELKNRGL